ncbi:MAG TPA: hypothetical protein VGW38_14205 [Chloroflexota bacterium]|nr:hypothetical protein [Chloroflexota bacterium]
MQQDVSLVEHVLSMAKHRGASCRKITGREIERNQRSGALDDFEKAGDASRTFEDALSDHSELQDALSNAYPPPGMVPQMTHVLPPDPESDRVRAQVERLEQRIEQLERRVQELEHGHEKTEQGG